MSVVVTIRRPPEKPPLSVEEIRRVVDEDRSLVGGGQEPIIWTDPTGGQERYININPETGELETDDTGGDEEGLSRFLDKLRSMAGLLDARVFGEEEDVTDPGPFPTASPVSRSGCASVLVFAITLMAAVAVVASGWR